MSKATPPLDRRLAIRMLSVIAALAIFYGGLVALTMIGALAGWPHRHGLLWLLPPVSLSVLVWVHFLIADDLVLRSTGARTVVRAEEPELHAAIDRLSLTANIPPPRVALSPMRTPNSLAVGLRPRRRTVVVTETLRQRLTTTELDAVLAHEISHLANRDALVLTAASFYRSLASLFGDPSLITPGHTGRGTQDRLVAALFAPARWVLLAIGAPLTGALSRYREYTADRSAALLTGAPESLMSALIKLGDEVEPIPAEDIRLASCAHPFLLLPMQRQGLWLVHDHPPLDARLKRLARIAEELQNRTASATAAG